MICVSMRLSSDRRKNTLSKTDQIGGTVLNMRNKSSGFLNERNPALCSDKTRGLFRGEDAVYRIKRRSTQYKPYELRANVRMRC